MQGNLAFTRYLESFSHLIGSLTSKGVREECCGTEAVTGVEAEVGGDVGNIGWMARFDDDG